MTCFDQQKAVPGLTFERPGSILICSGKAGRHAVTKLELDS